jgi:DNA-binding SARP family transcriptional activator
MLKLNTLGGFSAVDASGVSLTIPRHRFALLALVAAAGERGVSRDGVLACLWPEVPEEKARARLQQMLHAIRQSVDPRVFHPGDPLRINTDVVATDIADFHKAIDSGDLERAVSSLQRTISRRIPSRRCRGVRRMARERAPHTWRTASVCARAAGRGCDLS